MPGFRPRPKATQLLEGHTLPLRWHTPREPLRYRGQTPHDLYRACQSSVFGSSAASEIVLTVVCPLLTCRSNTTLPSVYNSSLYAFITKLKQNHILHCVSTSFVSPQLQHDYQHPVDIGTSAILFHSPQWCPLLASITIRKQSWLFYLDHTSGHTAVVHARLRGSDDPAQLPYTP